MLPPSQQTAQTTQVDRSKILLVLEHPEWVTSQWAPHLTWLTTNFLEVLLTWAVQLKLQECNFSKVTKALAQIPVDQARTPALMQATSVGDQVQ